MLLAIINYYGLAQSIFNSDEFKIMAPTVAFLITYAFLQWKGKLPSTNSLQEFAAFLNSRGGNIIILTAASFYFFRHSIYLFYALMQMSVDGKIQQDNAYGLMGLQFVSSTAFGGAFGALLKTMTGESSKARTTDFSPKDKQTSVIVNTSGASDSPTTTTTNVSSGTTTVTTGVTPTDVPPDNPAPQV